MQPIAWVVTLGWKTSERLCLPVGGRDIEAIRRPNPGRNDATTVYCRFFAKVIEAKWPGFERAFVGFDVNACAVMTDDHLAELLRDLSIVRNGREIRSVPVNAQFLISLREDYGSAGRFFADWPDDDYVGLLAILKARASQLGGETAGRFLRAIGRPAFILTRVVVLVLIRESVVDRAPTSKTDLLSVQAAFNRWSVESGRDLTQISRILAMSVGA
ncbi:DNA-3-methyladenine glycosylase I [Rhizobium sp. BK376]|uniref:DNA-3-methyladenine glycosylase I n=1 Tax=Rhizobium sp. BK376 TaxID=2512149 RepID=UPI0010486287|nr:DNA-3-methyladenine glycosylase I [Rhizobium sp. BK376]TCR79583.1 DNA-3-methyladenine glycosylase I [Rhizobium sp. BK376]